MAKAKPHEDNGADAEEEKKETAPKESHKAHGHQLRYVAPDNAELCLTSGTTYDVIDWLGLTSCNVQALILNDEGKLLGIEGAQNTDSWEYVCQKGKQAK